MGLLRTPRIIILEENSGLFVVITGSEAKNDPAPETTVSHEPANTRRIGRREN